MAYNICLKVHDVQCREIADNANTYVCYNQTIRHEGVKKSRCSGWPQIWKGHLDLHLQKQCYVYHKRTMSQEWAPAPKQGWNDVAQMQLLETGTAVGP